MNKLLSNANSDEVIGVSTSVIDLIEKSNYKNENLVSLKELLKENNKELTTTQNRKRKSDDSDEVKRLKTLRKNALSALTFVIKGLVYSPDKTVSGNALIIKEIISRHTKDIKSGTYNEQTAKIQSLIDELEQPKNKAILESLSLAAQHDELKLSNTTFIDGVSKRTISDASHEEIEESSIARKKTKKMLDHLINHLNSLSLIDKAIELKELNNSLSGIIDKANSNIRSRNTRNNGNGEKPDDNT
jgi:hypothetical protein